MKKDSMMDNPVYDQVSPLHSPTQDSSMSISTTNNTSVGASVTVAANPVYGAETAHPKPQRSTIRHVQNPVYGDPSDKNTGDVYSSVDQSSPHAGENDQQEYSYAVVEGAARVALSQPATGRDSKTSTTFEEDGGFVEHEYAVVDKSAKAQDSAASLHDQTVLPYDQLKHEQGEQQQAVRLAENEDLGYSVFA